MGATAHYKAISPWALEFMLGHPWIVEPFVCWERYDTRISPWLDTLPEPDRARLVAKITEALPPERENAALTLWKKRQPGDYALAEPQLERLHDEWTTPGLDLDKTWRGILRDVQRCSARTREVCIRAVSSGIAIGPDLGYAPAEYHDSSTVDELARSLVVAVQEYQGLEGDYSRELEYVRDYYLQAAQAGYAMLLYLT